MGFLLADGYFTRRNGIRLSLANKDRSHLDKFAEFMNCTVHEFNSYCSASISNLYYTNKIITKFGILPTKTIHPPPSTIFDGYSPDLIDAAIAGFIDGDGSIRNFHKRKSFNLQIKCHKNWLTMLQFFGNVITPYNYCRVTNAGYALLTITNTHELQKFKVRILPLQLPTLDRKWDVIDLDYLSMRVTANENYAHACHFFENESHLKKYELANRLGVCPASITKYYKRYILSLENDD